MGQGQRPELCQQVRVVRGQTPTQADRSSADVACPGLHPKASSREGQIVKEHHPDGWGLGAKMSFETRIHGSVALAVVREGGMLPAYPIVLREVSSSKHHILKQIFLPEFSLSPPRVCPLSSKKSFKLSNRLAGLLPESIMVA